MAIIKVKGKEYGLRFDLYAMEQIEETFGMAYAITVTVLDWLTVYPRESVAVTVTVTLPDFATAPTVSAAPVVFVTVTPLQVAAYCTMVALFFAVAAEGVTSRVDCPWMRYWSFPVIVTVADLESLNVNVPIVGLLLVAEVDTVAVLDEVEPICVEPL